MYQDHKDLLSAFHKSEPANAQATYAALTEFGAPLQDIRPEDFADRSSFFGFGYDPRGVDISPTFRALILTQHGSGVLKVQLTRIAA